MRTSGHFVRKLHDKHYIAVFCFVKYRISMPMAMKMAMLWR